MSIIAFMKVVLLLAAAFAPAPFLARFMARVFRGERHALSFLAPAERFVYRVAGIDAERDMGWKEYLLSLLAFNAAGLVLLVAILMSQKWLPLNSQGFGNLSWHLALNTAISFVTNTNWQAYSGEGSLSYFSQAVGLATQNFASAATGMAVALALIRAFGSPATRSFREVLDRIGTKTRRGQIEALEQRHREDLPGEEGSAFPARLGNFWVDLVRATLYVLLPFSLVMALFLAAQGVPQNFSPYVGATSLEGAALSIPGGPAASQIAIKQLGSNGGGFFGANSAHPFENPTPLSNFLETVAILLIPAALPFLFGELTGRKKQGRAVFGAMATIFILGLSVVVSAELAPNSAFGGLPAMEGKETRIGLADSAIWTAATTAVSSGSVNSAIDSASPTAVLVAAFNMMLGEVAFGGVGSGLYGMLVFAIVAVFIAGLMVGRGPEYLGRKIEAREVKLAMIAVIAPSFVILAFSSLALSIPAGTASILNRGPRGFSEVLYAFSSAAGNNGSSLGGLAANTVFYNLMTGLGMLIGRYGVIAPVVAIAGSLAAKRPVPESAGTFRTDNLSFALLLVAVVVIVGGLTFLPALSLGPIVEGLLAPAGCLF
jgi:K+-transporting ATPase ATPase A chain